MITVINKQFDDKGKVNCLVLALLKKKFNAQIIVEGQGDLTVIYYSYSKRKKFLFPKSLIKNFKKIVLLSGENFDENFDSCTSFIFLVSCAIRRKMYLLKKKLNLNSFVFEKIFLFVETLLAMRHGHRPGFHQKELKSLGKNERKNCYAILCNDIKGKNIISVPYFIQILPNYLNRYGKKTFNVDSFVSLRVCKKTQKKKFCCMVTSNLGALDRIDFFKKLSKYKKVDCYGNTIYCNSNNTGIGLWWENLTSLFEDYKFVICFENSFSKEYITEKLPNAMLGNAVAVYRGAPNVEDYFNTDAFINYDNYGKSYDKMIKKIIELDKNKEKYESFLKQPWITQSNKNNIQRKITMVDNLLKKIIDL